MLFVIITTSMVVSHTAFMAARRGERDARFNRASLAETFARSGLQDAIGWFRSRSSQPISAFDPTLDPTATPPRIETIDPTIGLVREFEIRGDLWGRYEIRHTEVSDISSQRGDLAPGSAWEIGVRSYIFRRRDPAAPFDAEPNLQVGSTSVTSELRWLHVNPPAPAALCVDSPADVRIGAQAEIDGSGGAAIAYLDPAVTMSLDTTSLDAEATVTGSPAELATTVYDANSGAVFGMRLDELRAYSDALFDEGGPDANAWALVKWLEEDETRRSGKLVYVAGGLTLIGTIALEDVLLVVDGPLYDHLGHQTVIDGVLYVTGETKSGEGILKVNGVMISRGFVKLGDYRDVADIVLRYDAAAIERVRASVGRYRQRRAGGASL